MNDIFDLMHRAMFDQMFSLDEEGRKAKEQLLREAGLPEELIAELTKPGILEIGPPSEQQHQDRTDKQ